MIINGEKIADEIVAELKKKPKPRKSLAVVQIGDEPTMVSFIKRKEKIARKLGVDFQIHRISTSIDNEGLRDKVSKIAGDPNCGGIVLQLPLPEHINRDEIIKAIPPEKDVDNLTGKSSVSAPAVGVVEEIIKTKNYQLKNKRAAVVGLGFLIGKPVSEWLRNKCSKLQTLESGSDFSTLKEANLVVSGVGLAGLIKPDMLRKDAVMIDFGYDFKSSKVYGDFDVSQLSNANGQLLSYTPTPGGTGPILVVKLFENFYKLNP